MKIMFVNFTRMVNDNGGMAKVAAAFANAMAERGHDVSFVHSDEKEGDFFFKLDSRVKAYNVNKNIDGTLVKMPLWYKAYREISRVFDRKDSRRINGKFLKNCLVENAQHYYDIINPDIVVSHQIQTSKLFVRDVNIKVPLISMSHGNPEEYINLCPKEEVDALKESAVCQVLIPSFEKTFTDYYDKVNTVVIGNAIPQFEFAADLGKKKDIYKVIFVGKLNKHFKRPHILIEAFSKVADKFPNWNLELWGAKEGNVFYKELQDMIKKNHLENRVFLKGVTSDIPNVLKNSDIFVLPSLYEGFSLAMGEAMSAGLAVIGCAECESFRGMINDGKDGLLFNDTDRRLEVCLEELMGCQEKRVEFGKMAKKNISNFAPNKIWDTWENLLMKYVRKGS